MLDAGLPVLIVAARQCHARASTTLNVYMPMHCPAETGWPPKLCGAGSMRPALWPVLKQTIHVKHR